MSASYKELLTDIVKDDKLAEQIISLNEEHLDWAVCYADEQTRVQADSICDAHTAYIEFHETYLRTEGMIN